MKKSLLSIILLGCPIVLSQSIITSTTTNCGIVAGTNVTVTGTCPNQTVNATGGGGGDASTNTATSVDSEMAVFSSTTGKVLKRATTTGILKGTSGVVSAAAAGLDYMSPDGPTPHYDAVVKGMLGNNSTDNATALSAMITACPATGCKLFFPPGIYKFASGVTTGTKEGIEFIAQCGAGWGNSSNRCVRFVTTAAIVILTIGSSGSDTQNGGKVEGIAFEDTSGSNTALGGLLVLRQSRIAIVRAEFDSFGGSGAYGIKFDGTGGFQNHNSLWDVRMRAVANCVIVAGPSDGPDIYGGDLNMGSTGQNCIDIQSATGTSVKAFGTSIDVQGSNARGIKVAGSDNSFYGMKLECQPDQSTCTTNTNNGVELLSTATRNKVEITSAAKLNDVLLIDSGACSNEYYTNGASTNTAQVVDNANCGIGMNLRTIAFTMSGNADGNGIFTEMQSASTNRAFQSQIPADTNPRWITRASGDTRWGPGNATQDVGTCRPSAGLLDISDGTACNALGKIATAAVNKMAITAPATSSTLAVADGKTLTASNTLTFTGTDSSSVAFGTGGTVTYTIASGTKALATSAIASEACTSAQTATATGTATTDVVSASFNGDPTAVTGFVPLTTGMLTIIVYPTTNTVNFKICNNTGSSVTPGAITLNWRVTR